ncbi:MAG: VCBS repeat-containing protein [Planctomycetaceae bacterium]|nr:MAG: VCBS repeat-containing protein [Planctomycetaceae bacterium]
MSCSHSPSLPQVPIVFRSIATSFAFATAAAFGCFALPAVAEETEAVRFKVIPLMLDANEGIAVGDIDGDGQPDLVAGRNWYRGGDWVPRPLRLIEDWNGYVQSNGDYLYDVNGNGRLDVIAGSFLPTQVHWYENPGAEGLRLGQTWKQHLLIDTGDTTNEGQLMADLDGDGRPEWIVNSWRKGVPMRVWRLVDCPPDATGAVVKMVPATLGEQANGHGLGVGDVNGDGRMDVLVGEGWYEQPESNPWGQPWRFHADWDLQASIPMLVRDLDGDGRNDLVFGMGHNYGLYWWQNQGPDETGKIVWKEHLIDREWSQPHALEWGDLTGDGKPELITGKRYFAHNGNDPGGRDMPCLYYYRWDAESQTFKRFTIDEGHVGTGLQIVAQDLNGDGKTDIAVAGKSGTYVLIQQ